MVNKKNLKDYTTGQLQTFTEWGSSLTKNLLDFKFELSINNSSCNISFKKKKYESISFFYYCQCFEMSSLPKVKYSEKNQSRVQTEYLYCWVSASSSEFNLTLLILINVFILICT